MKKHLLFKVLVTLAALALLGFGINGMNRDPQLRQLKTFSIAQLEAGERPAELQFLAIPDGYLLPVWVVETHRSKRGGHAYVYAAFGSQTMQQKYTSGEPVPLSVWVKLPEDFRAKSEADNSMRVRERYLVPMPLQGTVETMPASVRKAATRGEAPTEEPLLIHAGSKPGTYGDSAGLAAAGGALLLAVLLWLLADRANAEWLASLEAADTQVFGGNSPVVLVALVAIPAAAMLVGLITMHWFEQNELNSAALAAAAASFAFGVLALWRNRVAVLLSQDAITIQRGFQQREIPTRQIDGLQMALRKAKGGATSRYTLFYGGKRTRLGSGLFAGGIDDHASFGAALRELVFNQVAARLVPQFDAGQPVPFGPLAASEHGLHKGKGNGKGDLLPWAEIDSITLKDGRLKIKQRTKLLSWGNFEVARIINLDLLLHLLGTKGF